MKVCNVQLALKVVKKLSKEDVNNLVTKGSMHSGEKIRMDLVLNNVSINLNMFGMFIKDRDHEQYENQIDYYNVSRMA